MKITTNTSVENTETKQVVYQVDLEESEPDTDDEKTKISRPIVVPVKTKRRKPVTGNRSSRPVINQSSAEILGKSGGYGSQNVLRKPNIVGKAAVVSTEKKINGEEVEEIAVETGQTTVSNFPKWQRLIGNYQITEIGDIIDELAELVYQYPDRGDYSEALKEAKDFQFQQSLKTRQKVTVRKDLNQDQFKKRANMNYDRKVIDEHYRVVDEGHNRGLKEKAMTRTLRPKQENYGTKRYLPHLHGIPQIPKGPDDWL